MLLIMLLLFAQALAAAQPGSLPAFRQSQGNSAANVTFLFISFVESILPGSTLVVGVHRKRTASSPNSLELFAGIPSVGSISLPWDYSLYRQWSADNEMWLAYVQVPHNLTEAIFKITAQFSEPGPAQIFAVEYLDAIGVKPRASAGANNLTLVVPLQKTACQPVLTVAFVMTTCEINVDGVVGLTGRLFNSGNFFGDDAGRSTIENLDITSRPCTQDLKFLGVLAIGMRGSSCRPTDLEVSPGSQQTIGSESVASATIDAGGTLTVTGDLVVVGTLNISGTLLVNPATGSIEAKELILWPGTMIGLVVPALTRSLRVATQITAVVVQSETPIQGPIPVLGVPVTNSGESCSVYSDMTLISTDSTGTTLSATVAIDSSSCDEAGGLSQAAIIGLGVGLGILALAAIAAIVGAILHRRRNQRSIQTMQFKLEPKS